MIADSKTETEKAVQISIEKAKLIGGTTKAVDARKAISYYQDTTYQAFDLYDTHKAMYANKEKWRLRPKAVYNLTAGVTDALCTLYSDDVIYDFGENKRAAELWDLVYGWPSLMLDIDRHTLLGGTTAVRPVMLNGAPSQYVYLADQIEYVQKPTDELDPQQITVKWQSGQGMSLVTMAHHWTDRQVAETANDTLTGPIEDNPYGVIPLVLFRNEVPRWDFFGEPARDLVAANLSLNALMTELNHTTRWQAHGQLVLVGAPSNYQPPIGPDTYITVNHSPTGGSGDAKYIQPGANIAAIIEAINKNLEMFFSARRIPQSAVIAVQGDSGVSLVAQQASLREWRKRRIAVFRPVEERLIAMTLKVINYHLTGKVEEFDPPFIQYEEVKEPMSDDERIDWEWRMRLGVATAEDVMMSLNPGMSEADASKAIEENLAKRRERYIDEIGERRARYVINREGNTVRDADEDGRVG